MVHSKINQSYKTILVQLGSAPKTKMQVLPKMPMQLNLVWFRLGGGKLFSPSKTPPPITFWDVLGIVGVYAMLCYANMHMELPEPDNHAPTAEKW